MNVSLLDYGFANSTRIATVAPETYRVLDNGLPAVTEIGPLYNVNGKPAVKKHGVVQPFGIADLPDDWQAVAIQA